MGSKLVRSLRRILHIAKLNAMTMLLANTLFWADVSHFAAYTQYCSETVYYGVLCSVISWQELSSLTGGHYILVQRVWKIRVRVPLKQNIFRPAELLIQIMQALYSFINSSWWSRIRWCRQYLITPIFITGAYCSLQYEQLPVGTRRQTSWQNLISSLLQDPLSPTYSPSSRVPEFRGLASVNLVGAILNTSSFA